MTDINAISADIAKETVIQGEKLDKIDQDVNTADKNTKEALGQLTEA